MSLFKCFIVLGSFVLAILYWYGTRPIDSINWSLVEQEVEVKDFQLKDKNGVDFKLSSLKGKPILLNFWATWCQSCVEELPSLLRFSKWAKENLDLTVLAVSVDENWQVIEKFFKEKKLKPPDTFLKILLDVQGKVAENYGSSKLPESFFINKNFKIIRKFSGPQDWIKQEIVEWIREKSK